jgi:hypothetical protein
MGSARQPVKNSSTQIPWPQYCGAIFMRRCAYLEAWPCDRKPRTRKLGMQKY